MTGFLGEAGGVALVVIFLSGLSEARTFSEPEDQVLMLASEQDHRGKKAPVKDAPIAAKRVPGGWKLPGDDTVYPYNPLVPPDREKPIPKPPSQRAPR